MKYLTSDNFKDFMEMKNKPAFGIPTVHYTNKIQMEADSNQS